MKSPNHETPSGDRRIARLTLEALRCAGFDPVTVSDLRTLDISGDPEVQQSLAAQAALERERLKHAHETAPPTLWFTYHCYYKAPDLLGPELAETFGIPYFISEPSISPSRRKGAWSTFAKASEAAIAQADRLFWTTARDRPALKDAGHANMMTHLPAFVEAAEDGGRPAHAPHQPLRLLTVAMMRDGDKLESYRRLAAALPHIKVDWHLTIIGDGKERRQVEELFRAFSDQVHFAGQIDDPTELARTFQHADLFVWPGVGEGVGMVYLEAQRAGLPVIAEAHPAATELVAGGCTPPNDPQAFAQGIVQAANPNTYSDASAAARTHIAAHHSLEMAAGILRHSLNSVLQ